MTPEPVRELEAIAKRAVLEHFCLKPGDPKTLLDILLETIEEAIQVRANFVRAFKVVGE